MKNKRIYTVAFLLCWNKGRAQLNESDTMRFQSKGSLSGAWQSGNVVVVAIRSKLDLVSNGKKDLVLKSQNNSLYQRFGRFKADEDINSRNYAYYKPQKKIYPFALLFAQTNFRRKIDYRVFGGIGVSYQALRSAKASLKFAVSLIRETTRFSTSFFNESLYSGDPIIELWRSTLYVSGLQKIAHSKLLVFYNAYWQPVLGIVHNNRVQADCGIELPVWKGLNITAQLSYSYEQVVPQGIQQTDQILTFGLSYQFKK